MGGKGNEVETSAEDVYDPDESKEQIQFYEKLRMIGTAIEAMEPDGSFPAGDRLVRYITKNAILQEVKPLLDKYMMWMLLPDVEAVDYKEIKGKYKGGGKEDLMSLVKVRMRLGFIDLETGYYESTSFEGDAFTVCGKGTTVAVAFAQRDFLSQVFMISQVKPKEEDSESQTYLEEELMPVFDESGKPPEALITKARQMCERVSLSKIKEAAERRGHKFSSETVDAMSQADLLQVILTGCDLVAPEGVKEELGKISEEG